jgi:hypothetical protein
MNPGFWRLLFALVVSVMVASPACANHFATVERITIPDARGKWQFIPVTPNAVRIRGDAEEPLTRGMDLEVGDRIRTSMARVQVGLKKGEKLNVSENSLIRLNERSVLQLLGEVYYRLRGNFSVEYGTVETTVEGTGFLVSGPDPVQVGVTEGLVKVRGSEGEVAVAKGETVSVAQKGNVKPPKEWTYKEQRVALKRTRLTKPSLELGLLTYLTSTYRHNDPSDDLQGTFMVRFITRTELLQFFRLGADIAVGTAGSYLGYKASFSLGPEFALGRLSLGGQVVTELERHQYGGTGNYKALHTGGLGTVRYSWPFGDRWSLEGEARIGAVDGFVVNLGVGVGVTL